MDDAGGILILLFFIAVIVSIAVVASNRRKPFHVSTTTGLSADEAIRTSVQNYTMSGWLVTSHTSNNATFTLTKNPSCLLAGLLLLIYILPGILYLYYGKKVISVNVHARQDANGRTEVDIQGTSTGYGGKETADRVIATLSAHGSQTVVQHDHQSF